MSTWTGTNKNTATFTAENKSASEVIYLVSEALDNYLIGSAENETLVTQDTVTWTAEIKN